MPQNKEQASALFEGVGNALHYDWLALKNGGYDHSIQKMLDMLGDREIPSRATVLDIAGGTGNPGVIIRERLGGRLKRYLDFDLSLGPTKVAAFKMGLLAANGWEDWIKESGLSTEVQEDIFDKRNRMQALNTSNIPGVFQADVVHIPLADTTVDLAVVVTAMHWFQFASMEQADLDKSHFPSVLREIRRTLNPGGILLFDIPGNMYDFGGETTTINKQENDLSAIHFRNHPYFRILAEEINKAFAQRHIDARNDLPLVSKYFQGLNYEYLTELLIENGYRLDRYQVVLHPLSKAKLAELQRLGGTMVWFNHPGANQLSLVEKHTILDEATTNALAKFPDDFITYELLAQFKAIAV